MPGLRLSEKNGTDDDGDGLGEGLDEGASPTVAEGASPTVAEGASPTVADGESDDAVIREAFETEGLDSGSPSHSPFLEVNGKKVRLSVCGRVRMFLNLAHI